MGGEGAREAGGGGIGLRAGRGEAREWKGGMIEILRARCGGRGLRVVLELLQTLRWWCREICGCILEGGSTGIPCPGTCSVWEE